jgi:preprotein translocase SecE subunit
MARNRQRAKERQARRKAQQAGGDNDAPRTSAPQPDAAPQPDPAPAPDPAPQPEPEQLDPIDVRADPILGSAPPQDLGQADEVLEYEQDLDAEHEADKEHFDPIKDHTDDSDVLFPESTKGKSRPRIVEFLIAVWAELKRVEWPDRQQMITLTGVVLGFVLIAGGYLGLLDALAQRFVNAIL